MFCFPRGQSFRRAFIPQQQGLGSVALRRSGGWAQQWMCLSYTRRYIYIVNILLRTAMFMYVFYIYCWYVLLYRIYTYVLTCMCVFMLVENVLTIRITIHSWKLFQPSISSLYSGCALKISGCDQEWLLYWLVVWNIFYFPIQLGIILTDFHIFQRGRSTTNQYNSGGLLNVQLWFIRCTNSIAYSAY